MVLSRPRSRKSHRNLEPLQPQWLRSSLTAGHERRTLLAKGRNDRDQGHKKRTELSPSLHLSVPNALFRTGPRSERCTSTFNIWRRTGESIGPGRNQKILMDSVILSAGNDLAGNGGTNDKSISREPPPGTLRLGKPGRRPRQLQPLLSPDVAAARSSPGSAADPQTLNVAASFHHCVPAYLSNDPTDIGPPRG